MSLKLSVAAVATVASFLALPASAVTLTFDNLAVGTVLSNQYASVGAVFTANAFSGPGSSTTGAPWATNTDMTIVSSAGSDVGGLGTPNLVGGNILRSFNGWLGENGDPSFRVTMGAGTTAFSATFAGVATPADVRLFVYNGSTLLSTVVGTVATGQFTLSYAAGPFSSVVITPGSYDDWVGVDNISFTPAAVTAVPEPGAYAMLALGLAMLPFGRRRFVRR